MVVLGESIPGTHTWLLPFLFSSLVPPVLGGASQKCMLWSLHVHVLSNVTLPLPAISNHWPHWKRVYQFGQLLGGQALERGLGRHWKSLRSIWAGNFKVFHSQSMLGRGLVGRLLVGMSLWPQGEGCS